MIAHAMMFQFPNFTFDIVWYNCNVNSIIGGTFAGKRLGNTAKGWETQPFPQPFRGPLGVRGPHWTPSRAAKCPRNGSLTPLSYREWEDKWQVGPSIWSGSNENKNDGVAVLIKNPRILVKGSTVVRPGRALLIHLTYLGRDFNLLNVYGFNDKHSRYDFLEELQPHMLGRDPLVVGGDFNCVLSRKDRRGAGEDFKVDKTSVLLQGICRDFRLVDCFKTLHPGDDGFTWFNGDGSRASRIDYVFTRDCPPTDVRLTPVFFSDHVMLSVTLSLPSRVTVGKGLWKLNCSLLEDREVVSQYREQFSQWKTLQDCYDSRALWWEMVKGRTQTFFKQAGKRKKDREDRRMLGLQKRLQRYFNYNQQGFDFNDLIKEVKQEMSMIAETKSKGIILRSREREIEEGEKCTRYFLERLLTGGRQWLN